MLTQKNKLRLTNRTAGRIFVLIFGASYNLFAGEKPATRKKFSMGLFSFFKKQNTEKLVQPGRLILQGPNYLRRHLIKPSEELSSIIKITRPDTQWCGQLISSANSEYFRINYFGDLRKNETIISSGERTQRLVATDPQTNEEILLFDKAIHGWEGFMTDLYEDQKSTPRPTNKLYKVKTGVNTFRIVFMAYYNEGTRQELLDNKDANDQVTLENNSKLNVQDAFDDAFDWVVIYGIDQHGKKYELVNEELG